MTTNPATDWIDAAKTKPDNCRTVLIHVPNNPETSQVTWPGYYDSDTSYRWYWVFELEPIPTKLKVTHWRDFPEPPK